MAGRAGPGVGYGSRGGGYTIGGSLADGGKSPSKARLSMDGGKARRPTSSGPGADDAGLSAASTPVRSTSQDWRAAQPGEGAGTLSWADSDERFVLSGGSSQRSMDARSPLPVLSGRVFYCTASADPAAQAGVFFFSVEKTMKYMPFCGDFGPFNLGMTHSFCAILKEHLTNPRLRDSKIVFHSSPEPTAVTNAVYLLGAFLTVHLGASPDQAWLPFSGIHPSPVRPYRDATWAPSPFDLLVQDCWAGLAKARDTGLYDPASFDKDEYKYYDHPSNGDMHEVVKGKFFAFKGPTGRRRALGYGRYSLIPSDYFDVWRFKKITMVVRLNSKEYDRNVVVQGGFKHVDLFFIDCSTPSDAIVDKFLRIAEGEPGAIAVHCLAGLGRTGTLIALYMMKHHRFTAREAMGWLRICRPGSVIGPQQQYLVSQEKRMWDIGQRGVQGLGIGGGDSVNSSSNISSAAEDEGEDQPANQLAQMVTKGMRNRDSQRVSGSNDVISASKPAGNAHVRQSASFLANNYRGAQPPSPPAARGAVARSGSGVVRGASAGKRAPGTPGAGGAGIQSQLLRAPAGPSTPNPRTPATAKRQQLGGVSFAPRDAIGGRAGANRASLGAGGGGAQRLRMSVR